MEGIRRILVTHIDESQFRFLRTHSKLEANCWRPTTSRIAGIAEGELFLFRLKAPYHSIAGGGTFVDSGHLSVKQAWDAYGEANGARDYPSFRKLVGKIDKLRQKNLAAPSGQPATRLNCNLISQLFFFNRHQWFPAPQFGQNIQSYKIYRAQEQGFDELRSLLFSNLDALAEKGEFDYRKEPRYGRQRYVVSRLGQATFRKKILECYSYRCTISREKSEPVLEAAHIKPYSEYGPNEISNGLLLRADIHKLFDRGYVTVTPKLEFRVSKKLKQDFGNGKIYYEYDGEEIMVPDEARFQPSSEHLRYHNDRIFLD